MSRVRISPGTSLAGEMAQARPTTASVLKKLDPTMLPRTNSFSPRLAEATALASSGSEVPMAIIVRPIIRSLTPITFARSTAPQTRMCDEPTRSTRPTRTLSAAVAAPPCGGAAVACASSSFLPLVFWSNQQ